MNTALKNIVNQGKVISIGYYKRMRDLLFSNTHSNWKYKSYQIEAIASSTDILHFTKLGSSTIVPCEEKDCVLYYRFCVISWASSVLRQLCFKI